MTSGRKLYPLLSKNTMCRHIFSETTRRILERYNHFMSFRILNFMIQKLRSIHLLGSSHRLKLTTARLGFLPHDKKILDRVCCQDWWFFSILEGKKSKSLYLEVLMKKNIESTCKVLWLLSSLKDMKVDVTLPVAVHTDSKSTIQLAAKTVFITSVLSILKWIAKRKSLQLIIFLVLSNLQIY